MAEKRLPRSGPSLGLLLLLFLVVVPQRLLEVADALADATTELGQAAGPEDEDDDDEEENHLGEAEVEHDIPSRESAARLRGGSWIIPRYRTSTTRRPSFRRPRRSPWGSIRTSASTAARAA